MRAFTPAILLLATIAVADPFYDSEETATEQAVEITENFAKNQPKTTACQPTTQLDQARFSQTFAKLKLVGIVKFGEQFKALFLNEEQQLIDLKSYDIIEPEMIQIEQIDLKSVRYIQWQKSTQCDNPLISIIKL